MGHAEALGEGPHHICHVGALVNAAWASLEVLNGMNEQRQLRNEVEASNGRDDSAKDGSATVTRGAAVCSMGGAQAVQSGIRSNHGCAGAQAVKGTWHSKARSPEDLHHDALRRPTISSGAMGTLELLEHTLDEHADGCVPEAHMLKAHQKLADSSQLLRSRVVGVGEEHLMIGGVLRARCHTT